MAQQTNRTDHGGPPTGEQSKVQQAGEVIGEMMEAGAIMVGRGVAAGVESLSQLANRAAQLTAAAAPQSVVRGTQQAAKNTLDAAKTVARSATGTGHQRCRADP